MPLPFFPLVIAGLVAGAYHQTRKSVPDKGVLTPTRALVYEQALNLMKEPDKLRKLAEAFRNEGLPAQAEMLEKRAKLRELPPETKAARKDVFRKGMTSQDPAAVMQLANVFESEGATGAAATLRKYASGLKPPLPVNVPPPTPAATVPVTIQVDPIPVPPKQDDPNPTPHEAPHGEGK